MLRSALALSLCVFAVGSAHSQAGAPEDAKREGEVVWYTAMNTQEADALRRIFEKKYPFLTLTVLRQPGEKLRTRILSEARARKASWDVVSFNLLDMDALAEEGLLASYVSPETLSGFPKGAVDPGGRWAALYVRLYVLGFNTRLVPPRKVPKDWAELLEPQWKGRVALDESDVEWYASMLEYWGRDRGSDFMRALARQEPTFRRGHTLLFSLLVAGDFPLALVLASEIDQAKGKGAPVDWVRSTDPIVASPSLIAVSAKAPHPHAARLFVDFMLSFEGQAAVRERGRMPARADVAARGAATELKLHYVNPKLAREFSRAEAEFQDIFLKGL
jgi:iron(III) transport system substrate-binding protein